MKKMGRRERWKEATAEALEALSELIDLQDEYQEWLANMPEDDSEATREKLKEVTQLCLDDARDLIEEANAIELPQGFGRD